jgi:hypothetical protein
MFEGFIPRLKIGCVQPGAVIDNAPYEFYRLARATATCSQHHRKLE